MARKRKPTGRKSAKGRGKGYRDRQVKIREIRQKFLIVCEGAKTEPNYFIKFQVPKLVVDVKGLGLSPSQLVDAAQELRLEDDYDQVWCVFDRDEWDNFNDAFSKARQRNVKIAYSNEAFELWFLLHFNYYDTKIPRSEYISRLSQCLDKPYQKNSETIFDELEGKIGQAIHNAERLMKQYDPPNPSIDNPSTTVHLLVKELQKFSR